MADAEPDPPYEKYAHVYRAVMTNFLNEHLFKKEYIDGYYIDSIMTDEHGDFVLRLKRSFQSARH
jgi:hypothetical protein